MPSPLWGALNRFDYRLLAPALLGCTLAIDAAAKENAANGSCCASCATTVSPVPRGHGLLRAMRTHRSFPGCASNTATFRPRRRPPGAAAPAAGEAAAVAMWRSFEAGGGDRLPRDRLVACRLRRFDAASRTAQRGTHAPRGARGAAGVHRGAGHPNAGLDWAQRRRQHRIDLRRRPSEVPRAVRY